MIGILFGILFGIAYLIFKPSLDITKENNLLLWYNGVEGSRIFIKII